MEEIQKLRQQLTALTRAHIPGGQNPEKRPAASPTPPLQQLLMLPPTAQQASTLRQILLAGFPDRVAKLDAGAAAAASKSWRRRTSPAYLTMWGAADEEFFIHPASCLATVRPPPAWIVYEQVVAPDQRFGADGTTVVPDDRAGSSAAAGSDGTAVAAAPRRRLLKNVTAISDVWLARVGPRTLLRAGRPLDEPEPRYDFAVDAVVAISVPSYGPARWELPPVEAPLESSSAAAPWFARALLEGNVAPGWSSTATRRKRDGEWPPRHLFSMMLPYLSVKPSIMAKPWARIQKKVTELVAALVAARVFSRKALVEKWSAIFLDIYKLWLPAPLHAVAETFWPPIGFARDTIVRISAPGADRRPCPPDPSSIDALQAAIAAVAAASGGGVVAASLTASSSRAPAASGAAAAAAALLAAADPESEVDSD
ncbi:hypothetical protein HK405_012639 [Cladochytrium tenue]|nr:hypothetical protein HK405_012639 [Cladochytrium tenue]